ncbi:MAG: hypothetical protein H7A23_23505 [Leptospiraceae bacterium]|nr:hypothetical protein [Leptospiraceae bacterium]MCP5497530.1 hypothetical protein [Leptospiraceae bacterium]
MNRYFLVLSFFFVYTSLFAGIYHHKLRQLEKPRYQPPPKEEKVKRGNLNRDPFAFLSQEPIPKKEKPKEKKKDMEFENFLDFDMDEDDDIDVTDEDKSDETTEVKEVPKDKKEASSVPTLEPIERNLIQDEKAWVKQFVKQSSTNTEGDEIILWVEASNQYPEVRFYVKFIFDNVDYDRNFTITWKPKEEGTSDSRIKKVKIPQYQGSVFDYRFLANHYEDYKQGRLIRGGVWNISITDENEKELITADYKVPLYEEAGKSSETKQN